MSDNVLDQLRNKRNRPTVPARTDALVPKPQPQPQAQEQETLTQPNAEEQDLRNWHSVGTSSTDGLREKKAGR